MNITFCTFFLKTTNRLYIRENKTLKKLSEDANIFLKKLNPDLQDNLNCLIMFETFSKRCMSLCSTICA